MRAEQNPDDRMSNDLPTQSPNRRFTIFSKYQNESQAINEEDEKLNQDDFEDLMIDDQNRIYNEANPTI